jgi:undecaprenyl-diphosphatase
MRALCVWLLTVGLCTLLLPDPASAGACRGDSGRGGIFKLDRCDEFEATGIWSRRNQRLLDDAVVAGAAGVALWQGTATPFGSTAWKAMDSMVTTAAVTEVMKRAFQRPRPSQSADPDVWGRGRQFKSFPSGETAMVAAAVTPVIVDWHAEQPAVWALVALPAYMAQARMGSQSHWLSDVLVGAGVGVGGGLLAARRDKPLILMPLHDGLFVGWSTRF